MSINNQTLSDSEDSVIRIKAGRVAQLMDMVGELSLAADEVLHHPQLQELELDELQNSAHKLHQLIRELQDLASGLRLVPIDSVFRRMQRLARDLAKQTGKKFTFEIKGEETEIDKVVVDTLSDPLVHLIRNSVDHGLETNEERLKKGKPEKGRVTLAARQEGGDIYITIEDDGNGLDKDKILKRAIEKGLVSKHETLSEDKIFSLIFEPGFSTKDAVSQLSGRGVGMDVVKTTINYLRGRIDIMSTPGKGTCLQLVIPLSVAFLNTMVVSAQNKLFAIAIENVAEVLQSCEISVSRSSAADHECVRVRDQLVPIRSIASIHGLAQSESEKSQHKILVVVSSFDGAVALPVDNIVGQFQVTIKPLTGFLKKIRAVSGCALLPSADVAWVLDTSQVTPAKTADNAAQRRNAS
jgi:two-component system chemotaxis sensor kinase CheA